MFINATFKDKIILWIMNILFIFFPALLCDFPIWLSLTLVFLAISVPYISVIATIVIWLFSFLNIINMSFGILTIFYFILLIARIIIAFMPTNK